MTKRRSGGGGGGGGGGARGCGHVMVNSNSVRKSLNHHQQQRERRCSGCSSDTGQWLCLQCGAFGCGRYTDCQQALKHRDSAKHPIVLSVDTMQVWCYECDEELLPSNGKQLQDVVNLVRKQLDRPRAAASASSVAASSVSADCRGLSNLGNTCFFNSTLQCLAHAADFCDRLVQHVSSESYQLTVRLNAETVELNVAEPCGPVTRNLAATLQAIRSVGQGAYRPSALLDSVSRMNSRFRGRQQQDAHELLRTLLDACKMEEVRRRQAAVLASCDLSKQTNPASVQQQLRERVRRLDSLVRDSTLVDELCSGRLVSVLVCLRCNRQSRTPEIFQDLMLPIVDTVNCRQLPTDAGASSPKSAPDAAGAKASKHLIKKQQAAGKRQRRRNKQARQLEKGALDGMEGEKERHSGSDVDALARDVGSLIVQPPASAEGNGDGEAAGKEADLLNDSNRDAESVPNDKEDAELHKDDKDDAESRKDDKEDAESRMDDKEDAESRKDDKEDAESRKDDKEDAKSHKDDKEDAKSHKDDKEDAESCKDDKEDAKSHKEDDKEYSESCKDDKADAVGLVNDADSVGRENNEKEAGAVQRKVGDADEKAGGCAEAAEESDPKQLSRTDTLEGFLADAEDEADADSRVDDWPPAGDSVGDSVSDSGLEPPPPGSLEHCLYQFGVAELLTAGNRVHCDACKCRTDHSKRLQLERPPRLLTLQLKRFAQHGRSLRKSSARVSYPLLLHLHTCLQIDGGVWKYRLRSLVEHSGQLSAGHYTAYVCPDSGQWHHISDSHVSRVSERQALSAEAYLLFYTCEQSE